MGPDAGFAVVAKVVAEPEGTETEGTETEGTAVEVTGSEETVVAS